MAERETSHESSTWRGLLIVGVFAFVAALALVTKEHGDSKGMFGDDPNYTLPLVVGGVGAFLVLLAVILYSGSRR